MNKTIKVVIGSQYGDEGKGRTIDYLASHFSNGIVIRYNSGAQAGHTVVANGKRHVFHHIGSGAYAGLPTFLSKWFVCNPILFLKEYEELKESKVYVDPLSPITTPYDMMINQIIEKARDLNRHGSCGVGLNETIERGDAGFHIDVRDLPYPTRLRSSLNDIRSEYVLKRFIDLGKPELFFNNRDLILNDQILERFIEDCTKFNQIIEISDIWKIADKFDTLLFEGAQGLRLDQNNKEDFPYLTRSNTGLTNVSSLLADAGLTDEEVEVIYVTRCYTTRHGAGPLKNELLHKPFKGINETTNITNPFQGDFRYALLDLNQLVGFINKDFDFIYNLSVAVTCIDQLDNKLISYYNMQGNLISDVFPLRFFTDLRQALSPQKIYVSLGPDRNDMSPFYVGDLK